MKRHEAVVDRMDSDSADSAEGIASGRNGCGDIGYSVAILGDGVDGVVMKRDVSRWSVGRRSRVVDARKVR
jgi:hypothetical protein